MGIADEVGISILDHNCESSIHGCMYSFFVKCILFLFVVQVDNYTKNTFSNSDHLCRSNNYKVHAWTLAPISQN